MIILNHFFFKNKFLFYFINFAAENPENCDEEIIGKIQHITEITIIIFLLFCFKALLENIFIFFFNL